MRQSLSNKRFNYRSARALQICTVFTVTIFLAELLRYPHAGWTGFAVMMIYAGFDNGTTLFRAYHRFLGVLLGLLSGYFLWFLGHLDYRCLILVIPATVFMAYFLVGRAYSIPTVFTVNTSIIGTGYFDIHDSYSISYFLADYFICTLIAFTTILVFEHVWFSRYEMMRRFIRDTQIEAVNQLYDLVDLLEKDKIRRKEWFSKCLKLTNCIFEMNNLVHNKQFELSAKRVVGNEFNEFFELENRVFIGAKALYLAHHTKRHGKYDYLQLKKQVHDDLDRLKMLTRRHSINPQLGVLHEATP